MIAIPVVGIGEITGLSGCPDRQPFPARHAATVSQGQPMAKPIRSLLCY
jgi:hypothetical protein